MGHNIQQLLKRPTLSRAGFARQVMGVLSDALLVVGPDFKVLTVNESASALLGYSADHLVGISLDEVLPEVAAWVLLYFSRAELLDEEVQCCTKDGTLVPVAISLSPLEHEGGGSSMVVVLRNLTSTHRLAANLAVARDELDDRVSQLALEVARRKDVERQLRAEKIRIEKLLDEARSQLLRVERLATLGTLAGGVGHELNNVAMVQAMCVDEVEDLVEAGTVDSGLLDYMKSVDTHLGNHARRLLNLARPGPDYAEPLDLRITVRDTLEILRGSGRTKLLDVQSQLPDTPLVVCVNRARIEQILINLVGNAADAIEEAKSPVQRIRISGHLDSATNRVFCEVRDTGPGISESDRKKIFEAFYTTKPVGRGTGLGLPVVRQIVESYGGELLVRSSLGKGSIFTFDLPTEPIPQSSDVDA